MLHACPELLLKLGIRVSPRTVRRYMPIDFLEWLVHYGAPVLFAVQVLGIFGLPIPDEFLLTLSGAQLRGSSPK